LSVDGAMFAWRWRIDVTPNVLEVTAYANNASKHLTAATPMVVLDEADLESTSPLHYRLSLDGATYRFVVSGSVRGRTISEASEPKVGPFEAKATWPHLSCDPIAPTYCGFPFPSNVWTVDAPDTPTKRRVQFDDAMLPVSLHGEQTTGGPWSKSDGFSANGGI